METVTTAGLWLQQNYQMLIAGVLGIGATVAGLIVVYTQVKTMVQPVLDFIAKLKNKEEQDKIKEDVTNQLQTVTLDTQITDLKAKIENPTISDTLKQQYINQLTTLEVIKAKLDAGLVVVEETTSKF